MIAAPGGVHANLHNQAPLGSLLHLRVPIFTPTRLANSLICDHVVWGTVLQERFISIELQFRY